MTLHGNTFRIARTKAGELQGFNALLADPVDKDLKTW
jgi:hypothetical protein